MSDTLHLPLKAEWYDKIESGEKREEYREIKPYWVRRLCLHGQKRLAPECRDMDCTRCLADAGEDYVCYPFPSVRFSYGYTKRCMTWEVVEITIGRGNPAWGAPEDEDVFIIKLGRRIA